MHLGLPILHIHCIVPGIKIVQHFESKCFLAKSTLELLLSANVFVRKFLRFLASNSRITSILLKLLVVLEVGSRSNESELK